MNVPFVDLKAQYQSIKSEIDPAIQSVISETAFVGGKYVDGFEKAFAEKFGVKHCVSCANGTDAIYITLKALGIGPGDEVITVANSFIATSETISQTGARPVFVDIDEYFHIDPAQHRSEDHRRRPRPSSRSTSSASRWTSRPSRRSATGAGLLLIEDCAQSHFATCAGQEDRDLRDRRDLQLLSREEPRRLRGRRGHHHGRRRIRPERAPVRQPRLPSEVHPRDRRHQQPPRRHPGGGASGQARAYRRLEQGPERPRPEVQRAPRAASTRSSARSSGPDTFHIFHLYVIRAERRDDLAAFLKTKGIFTGIHYPTALPLMPAYRYLGHKPVGFPCRLRLPGRDPVAADVPGARGRTDRLCR